MCCRVVQTSAGTRLTPCTERTDDVLETDIWTLQKERRIAMVDLPPVDAGMLCKVLQNTRPSNGNIGLEDYAMFTAEFGQES